MKKSNIIKFPLKLRRLVRSAPGDMSVRLDIIVPARVARFILDLLDRAKG